MEVTVELLQEMIAEKQVKKLREIFDEFNIVDLAEMAQKLSLQEVLYLFKILRNEIAAMLFSYFDSDYQKKVIESFTGNEIQDILNNLFSDDIAEFMDELPANLVRKVLIAATPEQRKEINQLLSYPDNSAGSIMSTDFVELKKGDTISQAIKKIKSQGKIAETISDCYVVDDGRRLIGLIALESILFQEEDDLIEEYMETDFIFVKTHDDQEYVVQQMQRYDLLVMPVVNEDQRFIGIITVDDIMDVLEEEVTEDIQKMAAIRPMDQSYLQSPVLSMVRARAPWLLVLMVSATFTGGVLGYFEDALAIVPALAAFIPMIMGTAGNAGGQSSVMVIREISLNELSMRDIGKVFTKELRVSMIIGAALFIVAIIRIMLLPPDVGLNVALVVSLSLVISLLFANVVGALLPFFAVIIKQDPAAMAAPLITTIVDAVALIIYFLLCVALLGIPV